MSVRRIIDADCHISARKDGIDIGIDDLIKMMDENHVQMAVCWPMVSYTRQVAEDNRKIYMGVKRYPERIVGFGGVNPRLGLDAAMNELRRCHEEYGFKGIKLNGARDEYFIDDPALSLPIIEFMAEKGMMAAFHCGANDYERTHPFRIGKIARRFPELKILMIHMGGASIPTLHVAAIEIASEHPNIYLVDSEAQPQAILKAIEVLGPHRICYGSDVPFSFMDLALAVHDVLLKNLSEEDKAAVMGGNIARLLGL